MSGEDQTPRPWTQLAALHHLAEQWAHGQALLAPLFEQMKTTEATAARAAEAAKASNATLIAATAARRDEIERTWYADRPTGRQAARLISEGSGRLGLHRNRVRGAQTELDAWAGRWADVLEDAHVTADQLRHPNRWYAIDDAARATFERWAEHRAAAEHPEHPALLAAADSANAASAEARTAWYDAHEQLVWQGTMPAHSPARHLAAQTAQLRAAEQRANHADTQTAALSTVPAITSQPDPDHLLATARDRWQHDHDAREAQERHPKTHRLVRSPSVTYHPPTLARGPEIGI